MVLLFKGIAPPVQFPATIASGAPPATSPLHSRGSPTKGTKSKRAQKRAEMLHYPSILGGPQQRGQIKAGPKEGGNRVMAILVTRLATAVSSPKTPKMATNRDFPGLRAFSANVAQHKNEEQEIPHPVVKSAAHFGAPKIELWPF